MSDPVSVSNPTPVPPRPSKGGKARPATPAPQFKPRKQEERRSLPTGWIIGGVIAVLVLVAGVVAIVSSTGSDVEENTEAWSQVRPVSVTGSTLALAADEDPELGGVVPSFTGASFDGTSVTWTPGTPTLFVFLAHWCSHCQAEVPLLVEWFQDGKAPAGLRILGIATNTDPVQNNYPPSDWLSREGWPWRVVADSETYELARAMGVASFPNYVLVDAEGKLVWRASGELPIAEVQAQVDAVMAG